MEDRLFLRVDDLVKLTGTNTDNCQKIMRTLRDSMGKKKTASGKYQQITIPEYCAYEGIPLDEVCRKLKINPL